MAVESVSDTSMSGDRIAEVLDAEGSFDSGRKETPEGRDQRGETRNHERVDLRGRGLDVRVAHERTEGELVRSG